MPRKSVFLLVEDCDSDVWLIRRALRHAHVDNPLYIVRDGAQAIDYLSGTGEYADRSRFRVPDIVLLDLYMPVKDGFEVLTWMRSRPRFKNIRVIVLTASVAAADISRAYASGANSFLVKSMDFENLVELARYLHEFRLIDTTTDEDDFRLAA